MTREDLLKGNAEIAAQFGKDVRQYCQNVKHIVVIFNPADITGLITLLYSGLKPSQVSTLAALDSTRLQNELVKYFHIPASDIQNCRTYGGHGEQIDNPNSNERFCVLASLTGRDGGLEVRREDLFFNSHRAVDAHYHFGFRWVAGHK